MDQDLVVRAQQGDQQAFESLAVASHSRLFRVANVLLRDHALAEDATQQAFLDIWRDLRRLRDPAKFEGWSYRLLVRACYAEAKRMPKWVASDDLSPASEPRAADAFGSVLDRNVLEHGFAQLSIDHRAVLVLRYLLDMPPEQVAQTLGISRWSVYQRLKRAEKAMRAALDADARPTTPTRLQEEATK
jgi:RNA polymerase sigma-70 factor (ECF subfamily)